MHNQFSQNEYFKTQYNLNNAFLEIWGTVTNVIKHQSKKSNFVAFFAHFMILTSSRVLEAPLGIPYKLWANTENWIRSIMAALNAAISSLQYIKNSLKCETVSILHF